MRARQVEKERLANSAIDPVLQGGRQLSPNQFSQYSDTSTIANGDVGSAGGTPNGVVNGQTTQMHVQTRGPGVGVVHPVEQQPYTYQPYGQPATGMPSYNGSMATTQQADISYYDTMCRELGVSEGGDIVHDESYVHAYGAVAPQQYAMNH